MFTTNSLFYTDDFSQLDMTNLLKESDTYDLLFEEGADDLIQFAACINSPSGTQVVGFISCIIPYDEYETEFSAFVMPKYRKNGIFKSMYKHLLAEINKVCKHEITLYCTLDNILLNELKNASINPHIFSCEYLFMINYKDISSFIESDYSDIIFKINDNSYEAYINKQLVAYCFIDTFDSHACMYDVYTDAQYRNKGIATELVGYALNNYYSSNSKELPIILHVTSKNEPAIRVYNKCGFTLNSEVSYYSFDV